MQKDVHTGRHLLVQAAVVTVVVLASIAAAAVYKARQPDRYSAVTRIAINQNDAKSNIESGAVISRARALVTSRELVGQAIAAARVTRGVPDVQQHVTMTQLGLSSVVQLAVSDGDPGVAVRLADALSTALVTFLSDAERGDLATLAKGLQSQLRQVEATYDRLSAINPTRADATVVTAQLNAASAQRALLQQELVDAEQQNLLKARPTVIDQAARPTVPESKAIAQELALAALFGVVLAVALLAGWGALRPTVYGPMRIAEALDTTYLGALPAGGPPLDPMGSATVGRVVASAAGAGCSRVVLLGTRPGSPTSPLAPSCTELARSRGGRTTGAPRWSVQFVGDDPAALASATWSARPTGAVVVCRDRATRASLAGVASTVAASGWQLLGVVRSTGARHVRHDAAGAGSRPEVPAVERVDGAHVGANHFALSAAGIPRDAPRPYFGEPPTDPRN